MKKIGLLISQLNGDGAERVVSRLTHILSDKYEIYLILFENNYIEYEYMGKLINLDIKSSVNVLVKSFRTLKRVRKLKKIKKEINLDIVISFLASPNIVNILSKTKDCRVVISIRNYTIKENEKSFIGKLTNLMMKILYNKADLVIPVSKVIGESLVSDYGIKKDKIKVIYNPYNLEQINKLALEGLEKEYVGFFNNDKIFISVGRQVYQKGFWHLIKVFKLVHDKNNDTKLVIVGKDYQKGRVKRLIDELGLSHNVLLVDHHKNPFKFINNSSVYVLTSLFEGFPNAMVEAMACNCPIIATDCKSGPREILYKNTDIYRQATDIEYADYGVLVPEMNSNENWDINYFDESDKILAIAMLKLIEDDNLLERYSDLAYERAKEFNYDACKERYESVINSLIIHEYF